jgi:chromosome segregation ATPase
MKRLEEKTLEEVKEAVTWPKKVTMVDSPIFKKIQRNMDDLDGPVARKMYGDPRLFGNNESFSNDTSGKKNMREVIEELEAVTNKFNKLGTEENNHMITSYTKEGDAFKAQITHPILGDLVHVLTPEQAATAKATVDKYTAEYNELVDKLEALQKECEEITAEMEELEECLEEYGDVFADPEEEEEDVPESPEDEEAD